MRSPPSPRTRTGVGAAVALTLLVLVPLGAVRLSPASPRPQLAAPARSSVAPATKAQGTLPPNNPPANVPPSPNFLNDCSGSRYDDSDACVGNTLQAIAHARAQEGLPAMSLPTDWTSLSPAQQLYVATNLERTDRGLQPLSAMATALDQSAAQAAQHSEDPTPPSGFPWSSWGSNWAGAVGNPLEAIYYWMYDDGEGSNNIDCTPSNQSGCWGHRDNVLMALNCQPCVMGTALDPTGYQGYPSWTELLVDTTGNPSLDFAWTSVMPYLDNASGATLDPALFEFMANGSGTHPWNAYDQTSSTGSPGMYGSPAALADPADGLIHVFFYGANGHLLEYVNDHKTSGTPWSTYDLTSQSGASSLVGGNPAVLFAGGEVHVYIAGANRDLLEYVNDGANGRTWNVYDQSSASGGGSGISSTAAAVLVGSTVHVYVRGWNGDLVEYVADHQGGHVWNAYDQSAGAGNGVSVIGEPSALSVGGAVHVYAQGYNGDLVEFVNDNLGGRPWNAYDQSVGAFGGSGVSGAPSSILLGGVVHVFVAGANRDLVEYVNDGRNGRPWTAYDQTAATGATTGVTDRPGPIVVGGYVHVYGRAANGDLVEFLNDAQNGRIWNVYDQSLSSGGPGVVADPSPVWWGGMVHVYVGA